MGASLGTRQLRLCERGPLCSASERISFTVGTAPHLEAARCVVSEVRALLRSGYLPPLKGPGALHRVSRSELLYIHEGSALEAPAGMRRQL